MISVQGTFQNGGVVLAQPVNLPEGAHVRVTSDDNADVCCDGSLWDDSAEGRRKWLEWFDALDPAFSNEEAEQLQIMLRRMRNEQKPLQAQRDLMFERMFE